MSKKFKKEEIPDFGNNNLYLTTIQGGYLLDDESPKEAYLRLATTSNKYLKEEGYQDDLFKILWNGWFIPSSPVMSNFGTTKGLPISCFGGVVGDDMFELSRKNSEIMMLSKHGGGTSLDYSKVRPFGSPIKGGNNGTSDGIIPFIKVNDSAIIASKQGKTRRGAVAIYLNAEHEEYKSFLNIRQPRGEVNRQCLNVHQGAIFTDNFMQQVIDKNGKERELWIETLKTRVETGEPYTMFIDNANKTTPEWWKNKNLKINHSNLCAEIFLPNDENHTFVCCLGSLNLAKYDEWKDTNVVEIAIKFLDTVIQEFIEKGSKIKGISDAVDFAIKSRALGLGVMGWHTFLQQKMIPFVGIQANAWTKIIFDKIQKEAEQTSIALGKKYGIPEWCQDKRNLTIMSIPPTRSTSNFANDLYNSYNGGVSNGIEPIIANLYMDDGAKGVHIRRNSILEKLLIEKDRNIPEVWDQISEDKGSVKNIRCLSKEEKEVFLTFREINQLELIRQAAIRQQYIDQGQSINLAFYKDAPAKFINQCHIEAWKLGIKSLYYLKSESTLKADNGQKRDLYSECLACEA